MTEISDRIIIARNAIINIRKRHNLKLGESIPLSVAHGCIGTLGYIESGKSSDIMNPEIREEVEKLIGSGEIVKTDIIYVDSDMRCLLNKLGKFYSSDDYHIIRALLRERIKRIERMKRLDIEI